MIRHLARRQAANAAARDVAAQLLAQRERGYPPAIAAGKLAQAEADAKLRIMRAVVAVWTAMADQSDLPPPSSWQAAFGAAADEMLAELRLAYAAVRRVAEAANVSDEDPRWQAVFDLSHLVFDHEPENDAPRLHTLHAEDQAARFPGRQRAVA